MPNFNTKVTNGVVDDPLALDATYKGLDSADRRKIDDQILGTQTVALAAKAAGAAGQAYTPTLDGSGGVIVGDSIGPALSASLVRKGTARRPFAGIATAVATANTAVPSRNTGLSPATETTLGAGTEANAIIDPVSGRSARKAILDGSEIRIGVVNTDGSVTLGASKYVGASPKHVFNPNNYGADPTGVADSTSAVLAALADATVAGGTVEFPGGLYKLNTSLPNVTGTTGNGVSPALVTIPAHGRTGTFFISIAGVAGNTAVNGDRVAIVQDANTVALYAVGATQTPIAGNGAYTSGGTVVAPLPLMNGTMVRGAGRSSFGCGTLLQQWATTGALFASIYRGRAGGGQKVVLEDFTIDYRDGATTMVPAVTGIDMIDCSHFAVRRIETHNIGRGVICGDSGAGAGQYGVIDELFSRSADVGIDMTAASNAIWVRGGRQFAAATAGVRIASSDGSFISTTLEQCAIGVRFLTGTTQCMCVHSYFEGNTTAGVIFDAGSFNNAINNSSLSNGTDYVRDDDGRNRFDSPGEPAYPTMRSGYASGRNLIANPSFDVDTNADGVADGWSFVAQAGMTLSIDTTQVALPPGISGVSASQKFDIVGNLSNRTIEQTFEVTPGRPYTLSCWLRATNATPQFRFSAESVSTSRDMAYSGILADTGGAWRFFRATFIPTLTSLRVYVDNVASSGNGTLWIDDIKLETGRISTEPDDDRAGRYSQTIGPNVQSALTIAPTHAIQHVTGAGLIKTITPPKGFTGTLILLPDAAWATDTTGNIANQVTAIPGAPINATYDPTTGKWYLGGVASFAPHLLSGLKFFARADDVTNVSGKASAWRDLSGTGIMVPVQATGANRPVITASDINGLPGLTFDGANTFFDCGTGGNPATGTAMSIFAVIKCSALPRFTTIAGRNYSFQDWQFGATSLNPPGVVGMFGSFIGSTAAAEANSNASVADGNPHTLMLVYNGANLKLYVDNVLQTSQPANVISVPNSGERIGIGAGTSNGTTHTDHYTGELADLAISNVAWSVTERTNLQAYAHARYNI